MAQHTQTAPPIARCDICGMTSVLDELDRCHACQRHAEGYDDGVHETALAGVDAAIRIALSAGVGITLDGILDHLDRTGGGYDS